MPPLADLAHRAFVLGAVGVTGVLMWTTVGQARFLMARREDQKAAIARGETVEPLHKPYPDGQGTPKPQAPARQ